MVGMAPLIKTFVVALLFGQTIAHPGHSVDHEIAERAAYLRHAKRDLSHCSSKLSERGVAARAIQRRSTAVASLREAVKNKKAHGHGSSGKNGKGSKGSKKGTGHGSKSHASGNTHHSSASGYASSSALAQSSFITSSKTVGSAQSTVKASAYSSVLNGVSSSTGLPGNSSSMTVSGVASSAAGGSSQAISSAVSATGSSSSATSGMMSGSGTMPSGSMPSGGMPSGTTNGSMTNSTGGAGQLASSISSYGEEVADTSHLSNLTVTPSTSDVEDIIFGNRSCVLNPEGEVGPFYVTGELIRTDITESQEGIPIYVDGQFINVDTCDPIEDLYWDLWHANSTGVYGGVIGNGNGNFDDTSNLNNTFLRGLQPTDSDGVAQFQSVFPGHYAGRATHIHVVSHIGGTVLSNGTYTGGDITHVGQLFFDQDLITEANQVSPYSINSIAIVDNVDDRVFAAETESDSDPVFDYVLLGDDVSDYLCLDLYGN